MFPFPAWEAVMVQVPAETMWTVEPDTVQIPVVEEANETVNPESLVAETPKSASPKVLSGSGSNVIVWVAGTIPNVVLSESASWAESP